MQLLIRPSDFFFAQYRTSDSAKVIEIKLAIYLYRDRCKFHRFSGSRFFESNLWRVNSTDGQQINGKNCNVMRIASNIFRTAFYDTYNGQYCIPLSFRVLKDEKNAYSHISVSQTGGRTPWGGEGGGVNALLGRHENSSRSKICVY